VLEYLLLGGVPVGVWAMERLRRAQYARRHAAFIASLDADLQVVLHVANHEAMARHQPLTALHLGYGLLQDDGFRAVIARLEADPAALEDRVIAALDQLAEQTDSREALEALGYVSAVATHLERTASCADLWARLARRSAAAAVFAEAGVAPHRLLFAMIHGADPPRSLDAPGSVHVVLRNDDVTTVEFVIAILREVFELAPETAHAVTLATHQQGRAIVGRFAADEATTRIDAARTRARTACFPLWVGVEPC
jgi:ATP-dependent Clp protease adaptor protein ClpS